MRVFISSIMRGFEPYRAAAKRGVELVHHDPVMAEDFGARPNSPQAACLEEVAKADIVVLVLGSQYSGDPSNAVSATEQEYDEAIRRGRPVLAFVTTDKREDRQQQFIRKVEDFKQGVTRATYASPEDLKDAVITALTRLGHDITGHFRNSADAVSRFQIALSGLARNATESTLVLCSMPVRDDIKLTAMQIGDRTLPGSIAKNLSWGKHAFFDPKSGYDEKQDEDELIVFQSTGGRRLTAYGMLMPDGLLALGKSLIEDRDRQSFQDANDYMVIDQDKVQSWLVKLGGFMTETYKTVYGYPGPVYAVAVLLKMDYKMFGKLSQRGGSYSLYSGQDQELVYVPSSPEARNLPTTEKESAEMADEFIEMFCLRFRKDRRLSE